MFWFLVLVLVLVLSLLCACVRVVWSVNSVLEVLHRSNEASEK